jgi:hypothetical protein
MAQNHQRSGPSFLGLIAFLLLDLWLVKRHEERWFLLPAAIFLFLCYSLLLFLLPARSCQKGPLLSNHYTGHLLLGPLA